MIQIDLSGKSRNEIRLVGIGFVDEPVKNYFTAEPFSCFPRLTGCGLRLYVGLGDPGTVTGRRVMDAVAKAVKTLREYHIHDALFDLSAADAKMGARAIPFAVLGMKLGLYRYEIYRTDERKENFHFFLSSSEHPLPQPLERTLREAETLADGIIKARDLVNAPANRLTPAAMADALLKEAGECGVEAEALDERQMEALGMGALLAVGKSSGNPPRLIVLRYRGDGEAPFTALVGKGVTCDTGGYCLKGRDSMAGIKGDMAGGAAVAQTVFALAKNRVKVNVVGVIPACENRISRQSFLPGDVLRSMSGKTIEIKNTDAEGRLILADAATYAVRIEKAARIVDLATLTGAVVGALGFTTAGVLTDDESLWNRLQKAAGLSEEQFWRLPIYPEYEELLKSKIADIKNIGENYCGTITAGLFVRAFCEGRPWLHIDIAGTAWVDKPFFEHQSCGATGSPVATLYELLHSAPRPC